MMEADREYEGNGVGLEMYEGNGVGLGGEKHHIPWERGDIFISSDQEPWKCPGAILLG